MSSPTGAVSLSRLAAGRIVSAGLGIGVVLGSASCFAAHEYLFALPTDHVADAVGALLWGGSHAGFAISRSVATFLVHAGIGAFAGAAVALVITLRPLTRLAARIPSAAIALAAGVSLAALFQALWWRRAISGGPIALLSIASLGIVSASLAMVAVPALARFAFGSRRRAVVTFALLATFLLVRSTTFPRPVEAPAVEGSRPLARPLLLLGLDGLSWVHLASNLEAGRAPNLARLRERGASGELESIPPTLSPVIWTTMVTGVSPERHGIVNFTKDGTPYTSNSRRAFALWEILPRFGHRTAFHWWWASWPAEAVDGQIVTERFLSDGMDRRVHPPEEQPVLDALVPAARERVRDVAELLGRGAASLTPTFAERHRVKLDVLRQFLDRDEVATTIGEAALRRREFALVGVYLRSPDAVGHKFWRWHYLATSPVLGRWLYGEPDADQEILASVVDAMDAITDAHVGRLLDAAGPDVNVLIVSDHGFTASQPLRDAPNGEGETGGHHRSGMMILHGPDVRSGVVRGASVYDVFPTVLYLLGLPVPEDVPGRVLAEAIAPEIVASRPLLRIPSLGVRDVGDPTPLPSREDAAEIERLRALGYIVD